MKRAASRCFSPYHVGSARRHCRHYGSRCARLPSRNFTPVTVGFLFLSERQRLLGGVRTVVALTPDDRQHLFHRDRPVHHDRPIHCDRPCHRDSPFHHDGLIASTRKRQTVFYPNKESQ